MRRLIIVLAFFVLFIPALANAESGMYVGVFGGYTVGLDASWEIESFKFDLDTKETWAAGLKFGYTPPQAKFFAAEIEYSYLKPEINRTVLATSGSDYVAIDSGDAKMHNFMVNAIAKYPEGKIHPYFGFGLGASYVDVKAQASQRISGSTTTSNLSKSDTAFAWQAMAGVDFDITDKLSADIGYRYFYTKPDIDDTKLEIKTGIITAGLKFRF